MIEVIQHGDFKKTKSMFQRMLEPLNLSWMDKYGKRGVEALMLNSPEDTGRMAVSWDYEIEHTKNGAVLRWINSDVEGGCNVAILVQYGHATKNGSYVMGRDFINPALAPIFDEMAEQIWEEFDV